MDDERPAGPAQATPKNPEIQVLRALAVGFILVQHLDFFAGHEWGARLARYTGLWAGVDLFFGISGFVIAKSLMEHSPGLADFRLAAPALRAFWLKRLFRLLPAAWFWALAVIAIGFFIRHTPGMEPALVAQGSLAGMFGYANFYLADCAATAGASFNIVCPNIYATSHYWSLSREEQFYLVLSLALFFLRFRVVLAAGLLGALAFAFVAKPPLLLAWNLRFEALVLGTACYALTRTGAHATGLRLLGPRWLRLALLAACLAVVATAAAWSGNYASPVLAIASALALWIASYECTFGQGRAATLLAAMGDRSYSLYLCHLPAYIIVNEVLRRSDVTGLALTAALGVALAFVLAELSYRLIERPANQRGRAWAARRTPAARPALSPP